MTSFIALYRGDTVTSAQMIAVSADANIVSQFAAALLENAEFKSNTEDSDHVLNAISDGQRNALRLVSSEN